MYTVMIIMSCCNNNTNKMSTSLQVIVSPFCMKTALYVVSPFPVLLHMTLSHVFVESPKLLIFLI